MKEDRTPDLLDVLRHADKLPDCPDGLVLGWRNTRFDLMSRGGFQWGWPGQWTEAPDDGRDLTADHPYTACPSSELGGLCLAKTWEGALSGGVSSLACLVVAFDPADVLGQDRHKLRVRRALTLTVIDMEQIRSNLDGANLVGARLDGANLDGANLDGANLRCARLYRTRLDGADLYGANLGGANLVGADLRCARLVGARLVGARLDGADLYGADLGGARLDGADLYGADLGGANLVGADLVGARLDGANLDGADLDGARGDQWTRIPDGWRVNDTGLVVSS